MSARVLPDHARDRLAKLLGMMSSNHAAEVATFGATADRLVREYDLTWFDVLSPQQEVVVVEERPWTPPPPSYGAWRNTVSKCLNSGGRLNDWENSFLQGLARLRSVSLTTRQAACLQTINVKLFGEYA